MRSCVCNWAFTHELKCKRMFLASLSMLVLLQPMLRNAHTSCGVCCVRVCPFQSALPLLGVVAASGGQGGSAV